MNDIANRYTIYRVATGVWKIIDYHFFPPYYRLIIDFLILYRLLYFQHFHLKKLAHFWIWMGEEAKMGPSYLFSNSLYLMVHLDGYVQRILKTLKIIDWIIDYLNKKIDYRPMVDIIDPWLTEPVSEWVTRSPIELSTDSVRTANKRFLGKQLFELCALSDSRTLPLRWQIWKCPSSGGRFNQVWFESDLLASPLGWLNF